MAVTEMWMKIGSISLAVENKDGKSYDHITRCEALTMVVRAAPFIKILSTNLDLFGDRGSFDIEYFEYFIKIESFGYAIKVNQTHGSKYFKKMFELLADNTSDLTQVEFLNKIIPKAEALNVLFSRNSIKKVCVGDVALNAICKNKLADGIEELSCELIQKYVSPNISFQKVCMNS